MKIYPNQLSRHCLQKLFPIYWISGDEVILRKESRDQISHAANKQDFSSHQILWGDTELSCDQLNTQLQQSSLFSTQTFLELHILNLTWLTTEIKNMLYQYCENPNPNFIFLIQSNKLNAQQIRQKWLQQLIAHKNFVFIQIWPLTTKQFSFWLQQQLRQAQLQVTSDAFNELRNRTEGHLYAATQAIEHLSCIYPNTKITKTLLTDVVQQQLKFIIFDLVDQALLGNTQKALNILHTLQNQQINPALILWALCKDIRVLCELSNVASNNHNALTKIFQINRIQEIRKKFFLSATKRFSILNYNKLFQYAYAADCAIKGISVELAWSTLIHLTTLLASNHPKICEFFSQDPLDIYYYNQTSAGG